MPTFRKIAKLTQAEQYRENEPLPEGVCMCAVGQANRAMHVPHVHTIHRGQFVMLQDGDWVLPEPDGIHYYPCKPDVFADTYELVDPLEELGAACLKQ